MAYYEFGYMSLGIKCSIKSKRKLFQLHTKQNITGISWKTYLKSNSNTKKISSDKNRLHKKHDSGGKGGGELYRETTVLLSFC